MKTCPACGNANEDAHTLCEKCGQLLEGTVQAGLPRDRKAERGLPTTHWSGAAAVGAQPGAARAIPRAVVPLETMFGASRRIVIGRAPDCDVCLQHPSVSRYHALLERLPEGPRL